MALTVQRLKKKKDFGLQSVSEVLSTVIINQILSLLMKRHFLECVADCIAQDRISNSVGSFLQKLIPGSLLCMVQLFIATTCCRKWWVGKKPSHVCPFPLTLRQCSTPPPPLRQLSIDQQISCCLFFSFSSYSSSYFFNGYTPSFIHFTH